MIDLFKEELASIRSAKLTFLVGFVVLAAVIGYSEYSLFKEALSRKDDVINDKSDLIDTLQRKLEASERKEPRSSSSTPEVRSGQSATQRAPRVSGPATTSGAHSSAITGDNNTVTHQPNWPEKE
jgi:hypothetical protein